jgi:hypothetical protein
MTLLFAQTAWLVPLYPLLASLLSFQIGRAHV